MGIGRVCKASIVLVYLLQDMERLCIVHKPGWKM